MQQIEEPFSENQPLGSSGPQWAREQAQVVILITRNRLGQYTPFPSPPLLFPPEMQIRWLEAQQPPGGHEDKC